MLILSFFLLPLPLRAALNIYRMLSLWFKIDNAIFERTSFKVGLLAKMALIYFLSSILLQSPLYPGCESQAPNKDAGLIVMLKKDNVGLLSSLPLCSHKAWNFSQSQEETWPSCIMRLIKYKGFIFIRILLWHALDIWPAEYSYSIIICIVY